MARTRILIRQAALLLGVAIASAVGGYFLRSVAGPGATDVSSRDLERSELVVPHLSFSEVENTKAQLDDLAVELVLDVRLATRSASGGGGPGGPGTIAVRDRAIRVLEQAIAELEGTDRQGLVTEELLPFLEAEGRLDEWLERYLAALYRAPTQGLVGRRAGDALRIARKAGRVEEVVAALELAGAVPLRFGGQRAIRPVLGSSAAAGSGDGAAYPAAVGGFGGERIASAGWSAAP